MTDISKERCEEVARRLRKMATAIYLATEQSVADDISQKLKATADLITALCERVTELERERNILSEQFAGISRNMTRVADEKKSAEAALAEALRETDAIIEPFARFVNPVPQGSFDGPTIAMGDFQRADAYRRKRFEQMRYKGDADG